MSSEAIPPLIYLVEDDEFFAGTVSLSLENRGYRVSWIKFGDTLLDQMKICKPDAVVLDYQLCDSNSNAMNGGHFLEIINKIYPEVPVIMLTSLSDTREAVKLLKSGAVDFISKDDHFFEHLLMSLDNLLLARELADNLQIARRQMKQLQKRLATVLIAVAFALTVLIALYF